MAEMTKRERVNAFMEGRESDVVPVFPFILTKGVYEGGWRLPEVTTQTELDADKSAQGILKTIERYNYDLALGSYYDGFFGVVPLGGMLNIPGEYGMSVSAAKHPVESKEDWLKIKKKLPLDPRQDGRMSSVLKSIRMVADQAGPDMPIGTTWKSGVTAALLMLRGAEGLIMDMIEDPDYAHEMVDAGTEFSLNFLRAQYQAGANSVCVLTDVMGVEMLSPEMYEEFVFPSLKIISHAVAQEFGQKILLHIHGDFQREDTYPLVEKLIKECRIDALYFDEKHSAQWLKDNVRDKYNTPVCVPIHGPDLNAWSLEEIDNFVKDTFKIMGTGRGVMITPSCEIPPDVPSEKFKRWVDSVHQYCR